MAEAAGFPASSGSMRSRGARILLSVILAVVLLAGLSALDLVGLALVSPVSRLHDHYYLALGDSISYGYQPDLNFTAGFADDVFHDLQHANVSAVVNYACGGETTTTMIQGHCVGRILKHDPYFGAQLAAALNFLHSHAGEVNPITLDIGANDVLQDWDVSTCSPAPAAQADLATLDANLTQTILPQLVAAASLPAGLRMGGLVLLNYYNPYAKVCPSSTAFVHQLNSHLAADAMQFRVPLVDVYTAFGGDAHQADTICQYTWICNPQYNDLHPTTAGYRVIAATVEQALGIPGIGPGANPLNPVPKLALPGFSLTMPADSTRHDM